MVRWTKVPKWKGEKKKKKGKESDDLSIIGRRKSPSGNLPPVIL